MFIQKEPFDYNKWQENVFENMPAEETSKNAAEYRKNNKTVADGIRVLPKKIDWRQEEIDRRQQKTEQMLRELEEDEYFVEWLNI
jgi:hypothetical protein